MRMKTNVESDRGRVGSGSGGPLGRHDLERDALEGTDSFLFSIDNRPLLLARKALILGPRADAARPPESGR